MANNSKVTNYKYGICLNDECPRCKAKEVQELPLRKDFVCQECGSELRECPPPKKKNKMLPIIIAAAVVVVGGGGAGAYFGISSSKAKKAAEQAYADSVALAEQARMDSVAAAREAEKARLDSLAAIDAVAAQRVADSMAEVQRIEDSIAAAKAARAKSSQSGNSGSASTGSSNLGWASYSGPMQGGKPHGVGGTLRVTRSHSIDLKDGRGSTLQVNAGETIVNTKFDNGQLRQGELHRNDGTRKWFNI